MLNIAKLPEIKVSTGPGANCAISCNGSNKRPSVVWWIMGVPKTLSKIRIAGGLTNMGQLLFEN